MGRIHAQAWRRFKRDDDFDQAVDLYTRLVNRFPDSRLADDGQLMLAGLYEEANDPQAGLLGVSPGHGELPQGRHGPPGQKAPGRPGRSTGQPTERPGQKRTASAGLVTKPSAKAPAKTPLISGKTTADALATVKGLRHWSTPSYTRVVIGLERPVPYNSALLKQDPDHNKPRRLYLDLKGASLPQGL